MPPAWIRALLESEGLTDPITGLQKPPALDMHLWLAQMRAARSGHEIAVVVADVDDYSSLVRDHGWGAGDQVLAQVAERFQACLRDNDMVVRRFGDVFAGVCEDIDDPATVDLIARRIDVALSRPYLVDGERVDVSVTLGTAIARHDETPEQVIRRAENAVDRVPPLR